MKRLSFADLALNCTSLGFVNNLEPSSLDYKKFAESGVRWS
jgi:hypothetical protein